MMDNRGDMRNMDAMGDMAIGMGGNNIDVRVEGQNQNEPSAEDILLQLKSMRDGGNPINDGNAMGVGYQDYQNNYNYPADQQSNQQLKPWEENPAWKNEMPPDPSLERIKREIGW